MASKKDNLPKTVEMDMEPGSSITYANEVVAIIAGMAAAEVSGIVGMCNVSGSQLFRKNRDVTKGVKVETTTEEASVDLFVVVEYGTPIQKAAQDAQESVRKAIESMTGLHVVRVDVHVQGVSFEKENKALNAGQTQAALNAGTEAPKPAPAPAKQPEPEAEPADEPAAPESEIKPEVMAEIKAEIEAEPEEEAAPEAEPAEETGETEEEAAEEDGSEA